MGKGHRNMVFSAWIYCSVFSSSWQDESAQLTPTVGSDEGCWQEAWKSGPRYANTSSLVMQSHALRRLRLSESGLEAQLSGGDEVTAGEVQGNMWHVATALSPRLLVTSTISSCHKIYHYCVRPIDSEYGFRTWDLLGYSKRRFVLLNLDGIQYT